MNKLLPPPGTTVPPGMYLGIIPFVICQALTLITIYFLPSTATWLPKISASF